MPNEDHHDEKPLSDVLRARHSEHGKRRGLHGKTARKLHNQRYSPATECGLTSSNTMPCSPFAHPCQRRLLSYFELEGRDASHSLNRDHAWEHVPSLLHERAIAPPRVHKRSNGLIETSFALEPVVEVVADAGAEVRQGQRRDRRQLRTDGKIYSLRNGKRPVLFAEPPTEPPVGVRGSLLTPVRVGGSRSLRAFPTVRRPGGAAWDVAQHGGVGRALLEIDLGADCLVSHLSTQGREPPTRTFPQVQRERRRCKADLLGRAHSAGLGRRAQRSAAAARRRLDEEEEEVAELCSVEGRRWNLLKHGHYPGPFWMVLNLKGDQERCRRTGRPFLPAERFVQWVSRFEVHFRCDGGRRWLVLGSFKGNADATSEVAHSLRGLRARYLRIVPLDVVGEGALRVGVYGQVAAAAAVCGAASGAKEAPDPITYTLCSASEGLNTRYTHRERYTYRGGDRGWSCDMPVSMMGARRLRHLYPIHDLCLEDEEDEEQAVAMWQHELADVEGQAARPMPTLGDFIEAAASAADERTSVSTSGWDLVDLVGWSDASSSAWSEADPLSCAGSEDGGQPIDTVRVRIQAGASGTGTASASPVAVARSLWAVEGAAGFLRGTAPPLLATGPRNAIGFAVQAEVARRCQSRLLEWRPGTAPETARLTAACAGGVCAGLAQCLVIVPADRIKVQQQINSRAGTSSSEPVLECAARLLRSHGLVGGLLAGGTATAMRQAPSAAIYFGAYHALLPRLRERLGRGGSAAPLLSGGFAGVVAYTATYPLDVVKTRQQSSCAPPGCGPLAGRGAGSVAEVARGLTAEFGPAWLYRGMGPTLLRAFVINAVNFAVFERLQEAVARRRGMAS